MLRESHISLAYRQSKQVTDNKSLTDVTEVAKRRCDRERHGNRAQHAYVERGLLIYGSFHLR